MFNFHFLFFYWYYKGFVPSGLFCHRINGYLSFAANKNPCNQRNPMIYL